MVEAVTHALRDTWANPSSVHRAGGEAKRVLELARESIAKLIGCQEREIVFTSGGTEGANLAIRGTLEHFATNDSTRRMLVTTKFEHSAVRELAQQLEKRGTEVVWLSSANGALKHPAQPQAVSLVATTCGAESVPRKNCGLPLVAARRSEGGTGFEQVQLQLQRARTRLGAA